MYSWMELYADLEFDEFPVIGISAILLLIFCHTEAIVILAPISGLVDAPLMIVLDLTGSEDNVLEMEVGTNWPALPSSTERDFSTVIEEQAVKLHSCLR